MDGDFFINNENFHKIGLAFVAISFIFAFVILVKVFFTLLFINLQQRYTSHIDGFVFEEIKELDSASESWLSVDNENEDTCVLETIV
uniref:Uncharacterized protein n=1 Tax=Strongyloides venezuelensis TaxID=75913 RepID=A0A0K0FJD6_STRVS